MALVAGGNGLACLQQIIDKRRRDICCRRGILALEHSYEQGEAVRARCLIRRPGAKCARWPTSPDSTE